MSDDPLPDKDDAPAFLVICRDVPGDHPGGPDCWCSPYVVDADDDVACAKILELCRRPERQVD